MVAPVPSRRRITSPKPFARPSIEIGRSGPKRSWAHVPASVLAQGDTVSGVGILESVTTKAGLVIVRNVSGRAETFYGDQVVYAFVLPTPEESA